MTKFSDKIDDAVHLNINKTDHGENNSKPAKRTNTSVIVTVNNINNTKEAAVAAAEHGPSKEELYMVETLTRTLTLNKRVHTLEKTVIAYSFVTSSCPHTLMTGLILSKGHIV